jgi:hypothetical protein
VIKSSKNSNTIVFSHYFNFYDFQKFFWFFSIFKLFFEIFEFSKATSAICATHKQIMRGAYGKCATNKQLLVAWHWWRIPYAPRIRKKMRHL